MLCRIDRVLQEVGLEPEMPRPTGIGGDAELGLEAGDRGSESAGQHGELVRRELGALVYPDDPPLGREVGGEVSVGVAVAELQDRLVREDEPVSAAVIPG
jgi:hypothetical protein